MAVTDDLSTSLKEAMKAKDKTKLNAIRQIQTEIAKKKAEKGEEATNNTKIKNNPAPSDAVKETKSPIKGLGEHVPAFLLR